MNYDDVSAQLVHGAVEGDFGHAIKSDKIQTTALYFIPVCWFVAFADANKLFLGTYEGTDLRLVGTRQIKFADVTPRTLEELISQAKEKWLRWKLGFECSGG